MIEKLNELIDEWEKEEQFLSGNNEAHDDRIIGQTYGECAKRLRELIIRQPAASPN